jgi:hypothetical protein
MTEHSRFRVRKIDVGMAEYPPPDWQLRPWSAWVMRDNKWHEYHHITQSSLLRLDKIDMQQLKRKKFQLGYDK